MIYLRDIINLIYTKGTASEDTHITVLQHGTNMLLWEGKAKDLKNMPNIQSGWLIVEIHIDENDLHPVDYNKGKIITVI